MVAKRHLRFDRTGNSAVPSADPQNPILEVDQMTCRSDIAIQNFQNERSEGRWSVVNI